MKTFYSSATQIKNAETCLRRWFFQSLCKMPQIPGDDRPKIFGIITHAVCERFQRAPDNGEGMELFPNGWYKCKEGEVSVQDQALIKLLIAKAIEDGVLIREPGREVEHKMEFSLPLTDEISTKIIGYIDLLLPAAVWDYKTPKNSKWVLSKQKLQNDIQLNLYAAYALSRENSPEKILVGHKSLVKNPKDPRVIERSVMMSRDTVAAFWENRIYPTLHTMGDTFGRCLKEKDYRHVEKTDDSNECNHHYGKPCPYINICTGEWTCSAYRKYVESTVKDTKEKQQNKEKGPQKMSGLLKRLQAERAKAAEASQEEVPFEADETVKEETGEFEIPNMEELENENTENTTSDAAPAASGASVQEPEPTDDAPEALSTEGDAGEAPAWADKSCVACGGTGYNSRGNACRICQLRTKKKAPADAHEEPAPVTTKVEDPVDLPEKEVVVNTRPAEQVKITPPAATGLTLMIGCAPMDGQASRAELILEAAIQQIEEISKENYLAMNHFSVLRQVEQMARELVVDGMEIWTAKPASNSLLEAFVNVLARRATRVIRTIG